MPHQCTGCGHAFEDGSKEMLGGCPDCGGNKFQFYPEGTELPEQSPGDAEAPEPPEPEGSAVASKVGRATTKVRDFVSTNAPDDGPAGDPIDPDPAGDSGPAANPAGDPDPDAPWPDSSDAADPIRKGGLGSDGSPAPSDEDPFVSSGEPGDDDIIDADARATERALEDAEDVAQADARAGVASEAEVDAAMDPEATDVEATAETGVTAADATADVESADAEATEAADGPDVASSETPDAPDAAAGEAAAAPPEADGQVVRGPTGEEPDLAELREQLNDQFESIKILEPGQYELNLMELYDRDEYIIALQENGRYVIQVPENFMGDRPDE